MSYISVPDLPEFTQAVISFWFRVPQASVDAAAAAADIPSLSGGESAPFNGTVPLVVMGKPGTGASPTDTDRQYEIPIMNTSSTTCGQGYVNTSPGLPMPGCLDPYEVNIGLVVFHCCSTFLNSVHWFCDCSGTDTEVVKTLPKAFGQPGTETTTISGSDPVTDPTFIGFGNAGFGRGNYLYINFESAKKPTMTAYVERTGIGPGSEVGVDGSNCRDGDSGETFACSGCLCFFGIPGTYENWNNTVQGSSSYSRTSPTFNYTPIPGESASCAISGYAGTTDTAKKLAADQWHHVLISVDLGTISSHGSDETTSGIPTAANVDSACKLWVAIDDVNLVQDDIPDWVYGGGDNDVISSEAERTTRQGPQKIQNGDGTETTGEIPTYSCAMSVPAGDVGIPATADYVKNIFEVEMAEFMMWTGVTLDTAKVENRRLFITAPNKEGKQVPVNSAPVYIPIEKYAVGDPTAWADGADVPAFVPALSSLDPSMIGSGNKQLGTPDIDFTKCSFNWQMGLNLGAHKGEVTKAGKIKGYWPPNDQPLGVAGGKPGV